MAILSWAGPENPDSARESSNPTTDRVFAPTSPRPPRHPLRAAAVAVLALVLATVGSVASAPLAAPTKPPTREYDLKAVFLLHFSRFVEWPADALGDPASPILIGVLGVDPFGPALDEVVAGETRDGRPLRIRRSHDVQDLLDCHIVYISESESPRLEETLAALRARPVLTVGESELFSLSGGIIRFLLVGRHVRLRIHVAAAREARLVISSKLLRQAELFEPGPGS